MLAKNVSDNDSDDNDGTATTTNTNHEDDNDNGRNNNNKNDDNGVENDNNGKSYNSALQTATKKPAKNCDSYDGNNKGSTNSRSSSLTDVQHSRKYFTTHYTKQIETDRQAHRHTD